MCHARFVNILIQLADTDLSAFAGIRLKQDHGVQPSSGGMWYRQK